MRQPLKRVGIIGFEGVNALDMIGPIEALTTAGRKDPTAKESRGLYEAVVIGLNERPFAAESGIRFVPHCQLANAPSLDTVIVPGGWGLREPDISAAVSAWLRDLAPRTRRVATVCTGIYALAYAGLLDGRSATTHWRFVQDVARRFPRIHIRGDALFLKDGRYYTSGGVTAAIDLALALIEEDLGAKAALAVAREMVMYLKRPGGQAQYSEPLRFQTASADAFSDLIAWIYAHLDRDLSLEVLAARARLSVRHFSRRFTAALGCTPADFVETARLSEARNRLVESRRNIDGVAASLGFRSSDVFRRRFERHFGIGPRAILIAAAVQSQAVTQSPAAAQPQAAAPVPADASGPAYLPDGRMVFPAQYREWIFLTSGLDMNYSVTAPMPGQSMFDNVFVNPEAYREFLLTGTWPERTMLVKEMRGGAEKGSINKHGRFQTTELMDVEVHVKDTAHLPGGWGFFDFDGTEPATQIPVAAPCYSCHQQHAAVDTTFVQFYPTLLPVARGKGTLAAGYRH